MKLEKLALLVLPVAGLLLLSVLGWGWGDDEEEEEEEYTGVLNADGAHTDENPFCADDACECHTDEENKEQVQQYIEDGEMTTDEATRYYYGKNI